MALKVKFTHDSMAPGTELAFGDYFLAKNGEEVIISDEAIDRYERNTGNDLEEVLKDSSIYHVKHATKAEAAEAYPPEGDEPEFTEETVLESAKVEPVVVEDDEPAVEEEGGEN